MLTRTQFSTGYQSSFRVTMAFMMSRGIDSSLAGELAQAAWAKAWEKRCQLRDPKSLLPWVSSIALNLLRKEMRWRNQYDASLVDPRSGGGQCRAQTDLTTVIYKIDAERTLNVLNDVDRGLLLSRFVGGMTSQEAADRAHLSPGAIRVRMHRAKRLLQERGRPLQSQNVGQRALAGGLQSRP